VQLGLEEGFAAQGAQVMTIPRVRGLSLEAQAAWLREVQTRCEAGGFDQVWAEVVHSEWDTEALRWLETVAPKRVGLLMESLGYDSAAFAVAPQLRERRALVEKRLPHFTHVVAVDEQDAAELSQQGRVAAVWWPQAVPRRCISALPEAPPDRRALFFGQLYGERQAWLEHPEVQPLLWRPDVSPEDTAGLPPLFDGMTRALGTALERGTRLGPEDWRAFTEAWRAVRRTGFGVWLRGLQQGAAVVNLPSLFRGYAGRVVEAMAAGRPVISWNVADRPRTGSLFQDGSEILLFDKGDPAALAAHLRRLRHEPAWARQLAENARGKILRGHTVEIRMRQLFAWIETGVAPDYTAVPDPAEEASFIPAPLEPALASRPAPDAEGSPGSREGARELHLTTGIVQWHLGDLERAARDRRMAAANPLDDVAQVQEAEVAARLGHWPEAQEALRRALERIPDHPAAWKLIGDWSLAQGDGAMAVEAYSLLVARDRCDLGAYVDLAIARLNAARAVSGAGHGGTIPQDTRELATQFLPRARANVQRISRSITRGELPPVARIGHLGEARRLLERGDLPAAWAATVRALEARPFHPEGFLLLAEIAQAAGEGGRARICAERAAKLAPKWKPARNFLKALPPSRSTAPRVQLPELPAGLTSRTPRLTVCLIARNEERFLGQCLESIRAVADQIVVVDTGSTDWTKDIAVRFGAEVYSYSWHDDFSAARNAALEHATGDWVLVLDADEEVPAADLPLLRQEMRQASVMALRLPIVDVGREEEGQSYVPRLFRNAPGLFFVGRVHEQVFSSIEVRRAEWGLENRLGRTTLRHHGYVAAVQQERRKNARNLALLERALDELPGEPNLVMNYGLELARAGRPAEALERYGEAFLQLSALPREQVVAELRESLLTQYATHLLGARQCEAVIDVLESPLAQAAGLTASMHFLFGMAQIERQEWARAIPHFRACLAKRNQPALSPLHLEVRRGAPHHCLAACQMRLRRFTEAGQSFAAALAVQPEARPIRFDYAMFLAESGRPVEGLKVLHELITEKADEPTPWLLGARIALSRPEFGEFANDWTSAALEHHGYATAFQALRAEALLLRQDVGQAHGHWLRAQHPANPRHAAALLLCRLLRGEDLPVLSLPEPLVSGELLNWYRRLIEWRAAPLVEGINARLENLRRIVPSACGVLDKALHEAVGEAV
jgi:tetratricopeptide (TPR) repeat protein